MELNSLKPPAGRKKNRKRVGRGPGSGTGKTAGRGHKGQKSRAGYSRHYGFEGGQMPLHRRVPKRGFNHRQRWPMAVINIDALDAAFEDGAEISSALLSERGMLRQMRGGVKVLGRGEVTKKLVLKVQAISPSAKQKIEAAGGSVEIVPIVEAASPAEQPAESAAPPVVEEATVPEAEAPGAAAEEPAVEADPAGGEDAPQAEEPVEE